MKKISFLAAAAFLLFGCSSSKNGTDAAKPDASILRQAQDDNRGGVRLSLSKPLQESTKIWDSAPHSAFTSLVRYKNAFYCCFREASKHVGGTDGKIRVIRSTDGKKWESIALLEKATIDLRDPMLSIAPDNRLMLSIGGSIYDPVERNKLLGMNPMVSFADAAGDHFGEPEKVTITPASERSWIWRVTWHKGTGYGMTYTDGGLYLMKTTDGKNYERGAKLDIDSYPNESTVRFDEHDRLYVLVRREQGDKMGILAKSAAPYTDWTYKKMSLRLGGPNFIFFNKDKNLIVGTRLWDEPGGPITGILLTDLDGNILKTIKLPSKGDCSYPGIVLYKDKCYVSYYSSHGEKTAIYFTSIPVKELKP
jgi:hypothetical protein